MPGIGHNSEVTETSQTVAAGQLTFGEDGSVSLSRLSPFVGREHRAMKCQAVLPLSLFRTPELKVTFSVADTPASVEIDTKAVSEALKMVVGVDVDVQVRRPEE